MIIFLSFPLFCKIMNGICNCSVHGNADIMYDFFIIFFHAMFDPVEHKTDKAVFVKFCNKFLCMFRDWCLGGLLFDDTGDQLVSKVKEIIFNLFPAEAAVSV